MTPWLRQVAELVRSGRKAEAIVLARERAERGDLAAKVRLALFGDDAGISREEADAIVDQAELEVEAADSDLHWVLYSAYELRFGSCEYDEKARRALRHLQAYAGATNDPLSTYAVAVRYGQGDIGTEPNPELAQGWMERAAKLGHPMALRYVGRGRRDA